MTTEEIQEAGGLDLRRFIIKKQGREYLIVAGRLVWFRRDYPDAGIVTEIISEEWSEEFGGIVKMRTSIFLPDGRLLATGTARQTERGPDGFGDYVEKCETAAVGRALLMAGYGTANAQELEVEGKLAEAPTEPKPVQPPTMTGRSDQNSSDPTRVRHDLPPRQFQRRTAAPAPPPDWKPGEDEEEFLTPEPARGRAFDDAEAPRGRR